MSLNKISKFLLYISTENHKNKFYKVVKFFFIKMKFRDINLENSILNEKINKLNKKNITLKEKILKLDNKNTKLIDKITKENKKNAELNKQIAKFKEKECDFKCTISSLKEKKEQLALKNNEYLNIIKKNSNLYEEEILLPKKQAEDRIKTPIAIAEINSIREMETFPQPISIEIETINRCNGSCSFCPVNYKDDPRDFKLMKESLFFNIIEQLKNMNYKGRMQLFSNNEPLMDKRIFDFAKEAKLALPDNHFSFFTNGTLLNLEKFNKLIQYCDTFCIDIYYKETEDIPENIKPIVDLCIEEKELQSKVKINFICSTAIRNNRGGQSKNRKKTYELKCPCILPYKQLIIRPDGKISLCCNDALGMHTLGDLTKDKIIDVWNNNEFNKVRDLLKDSRNKIEMCKSCDNFGGFGTNANPNHVYEEKDFIKCWKNIKNNFYKEDDYAEN